MKISRAVKFFCAVIVMFAVSNASKTQSYNTLETWKASGMTGEYIDDGNDDEELDISEHVAQAEEGRKNTHEYENRSTKPEDVVKTYGLPQDKTDYIIRRHKDALKLRSNRERVNVYSQMFNEYEGDYLAAYYAALANFEMDRGSQAVGWCDKALAINHRYSPAIRLRKRSVGLTKKVR